jgi:uncharacterized membrane protein
MLIDTLIRLPLRKKIAMRDHAKSAIKAVTWRIIGTLDTILISYLITGEAKIAISIGGIETLTKILLYYVHERAWENLTTSKANDQGE